MTTNKPAFFAGIAGLLGGPTMADNEFGFQCCHKLKYIHE
jgi:hypothetical protein